VSSLTAKLASDGSARCIFQGLLGLHSFEGLFRLLFPLNHSKEEPVRQTEGTPSTVPADL
jgi:hypothetical protein